MSFVPESGSPRHRNFNTASFSTAGFGMPCGMQKPFRKNSGGRMQYATSRSFHFFLLWQEPAIAQCAHLHPQVDFPFFLSFTSDQTINATTTISATQIKTVG